MTSEKSSEHERFPLPRGVSDALLNRGQIARALGVTEPTVDRWIFEGMPVHEGGSNGRAYKFQLSDCWAWKCARDESEALDNAEAENTVRQMRLSLIGGASDDEERSLPPKERLAIYEAEQRWMLAARMRRELIPVQDVADLLEDVFAAVRDGINALPDRLARECALSGRQIERAIAAGDDMLSEVRARIEREHLAQAPEAGHG